LARISTYIVDGTIVDDDKVIGSDANNDMVTKNYKVGDLVAYFAVAIGDYLVPYNNATQDVDLGPYSLFATNLSISGTFTADGTEGLPGQVLISQGGSNPATWGYNIGSQDLEDVLNNGNTGNRNILLGSFGSSIKLDVESTLSSYVGIELYDVGSSNVSYWIPNEFTLQDQSQFFIQQADRTVYSNGINSINIVANNYNNQTFLYPNYGGAFVMSVNGVFADMSGNVIVSGGGGGSGTVTQVDTSAPLTGGPITTTGTIGISQATTSTDGYLSSNDWNTFNGKFNLPSLTAGSVLFSNGTTIAQDNANFFWDDTNNRLGIGTATPARPLDVIGQIAATGNVYAPNFYTPNAGLENEAVGGGASYFKVYTNIDNRPVYLASNNNNILAVNSYAANSYKGVGISDGGSPAAIINNSSILLGLDSTTRGFLLPSLTTTQRNAIATPSTGLQVYNNTTNKISYYDGSSWIELGSGSGTVTSIATAGLISGGTITGTGTISTSMSTSKLVGRYSSGTGVMEEISVGSGLTLTGAGILNNTATPTPLGYYGAFSDVTDQFATVINTGYPMLLGVTDLSNQVTVVSGSRVTIANTGIYNIQWSAQFRNPTAAEHDVTIWLRKNGVDVAGSAGVVSVPKKHGSLDGHVLPSWNFLLDPIAGDYYEFVWSTTDTSVFISFEPAGSPPPSTASVVLTVTQQSGIMAGTGITAINSLTGAVQTLGVGTSGTDFAIVSSGTSHTFNLPNASASNRGALLSADWTTFNNKQNALTNPVTGTGTNNELAYFNTTGSTISSLTTATYPSLTELSYVKGVTSAIQTQINALPNDWIITLGQQAMGSAVKSVGLGVPNLANVASGASLTSSSMRLIAVYLAKAATLTGIKWMQTIIGNYTANNENRVGLYTYSAGILTLVASSADDGNLWKTASSGTMGSKAFSSTYAASAGLYFIGLLWNSSSTVAAPQIGIGANLGAVVNTSDFTNSGRISCSITTTTLSSSVTLSATSATIANFGAWAY